MRGRHDLRAVGMLFALLTVALVLRLAGATQAQISAAANDPQGYVTASGADEFVLVLATALGWLLLAWIALGAVLVLGSAAPGLIGSLFRRLARWLLPATLRRFVTLALGISMLSGTSVASAAPTAPMTAISITLDWPGAAQPTLGGAPDWPSIPATPPAEPEPNLPPTNTPDPPSNASYVVQPGDCLWDIAERALVQDNRPIDVASVATAVASWWQANRAHIADPDLIYPGQVLLNPITRP